MMGQAERSIELGEWNGFNNVGISAVAIACVLRHTDILSLAKSLLIMPLVMHSETLRFLANQRVRGRQSAAFSNMDPSLIVNFNDRFLESLPTTLNGIQLLITLGYVTFDGSLHPLKEFNIDPAFGNRAYKIEKAAKNIGTLLTSSEDDLYLNLRVIL